jgi:hypothetical protein
MRVKRLWSSAESLSSIKLCVTWSYHCKHDPIVVRPDPTDVRPNPAVIPHDAVVVDYGSNRHVSVVRTCAWSGRKIV